MARIPESTLSAEFLQIATVDDTGAGGKPVEATAEHLLYVYNIKKEREDVVPAGEIKIGDYLITNGGPVEVVAIHKTQTLGLYSPLTTTGEIIVNGVLASNYVSRRWLEARVPGNVLHLLQHGVATSHRIFCGWFGCQQETYDVDTGFSPMVEFWYRLEQWQLRQGTIPRTFFLAALTPFAFCAIFVGQISVAPFVTLVHLIMLLAGFFAWKQVNNKSNKKDENLKEH